MNLEQDNRFPQVDYEPLQSKEELAQTIAPENHPMTLQQVEDTFSKRLEMSGDMEFLEITLAARCDRRLQGDPVWLFIIANSGSTKTEVVRALKDSDIYTLDSLTGKTLISGKKDVDPETGEMRLIKGILQFVNGKVLVIKDFTLILSKRVEERDEIFSQLRGLHDGYLEFGFGTSNEPVRIKADIGLIAATTPSIDMYGKLSAMLGERFLKVRHKADNEKTAMQAAKNLGKEILIRRELNNAVRAFIASLQFYDYKTDEVTPYIIKLAQATAILRTPVMMKFWRYEINEYCIPNIECPTRLTKQFLKLAKLLANIRSHLRIDNSDIATVQRVARDTCVPNRVKIVKELLKGFPLKTSEIADRTEIPRMTAWRELKEIEYLGYLTYKQATEKDHFGNSRHTPDDDGWTLKQPEILQILFEEISIPQTSSGRGEGVIIESEKDSHSLDVSGIGSKESPPIETPTSGDLPEVKKTCGQCKLWHKGGCPFPGDPNCITPTNNYAEDCRTFNRKVGGQP